MGQTQDELILQKVIDFDQAELMLSISNVTIQDDDQLREEMLSAPKQVFDLKKELPIRVYFYSTNGVCTHASIIVHHIAFDAWSQGLLERDLAAHYKALKNNELYVSPVAITYRDYAAWERKESDEERFLKLSDFWKNKLSSYEPLNLPTDFARTSVFDYQAGEELHFKISANTTKSLKELSKQMKVSLYRWVIL